MSDEKNMDEVKKKTKDGWIKSWMMIEVLAVNEETAKKSLENHVNELSRDGKTLVFTKDFKEVKKVENVRPNIPIAYSTVVELELVTETFEKLVYLVMNYAPSATEILEPEKLNLEMGELQGIVNSVADVIHKFAAIGLGGIVIKGS